MKAFPHPINSRGIALFLLLLIFSFILSIIVAKFPPTIVFAGIAALIICLVSIIKPEVALYILVFSMLLSPEFGQRSTEGSGVTLRVDDFLLVIIGLSWLARAALDKDMGLVRKTNLNIPILLYLLVCIISTGIGISAGNVKLKTGFFFVLKYFEYYVVYFLVVNYVRTRKQIQLLIISLLVTCGIVDLIALLQIPSGKRLSAPFEGEIGEPNTLGGYLVVMIIVSIALFTYLKSKKLKTLLLFMVGLSFIPFLLSLSRGSYLAFIPAFFTLIALSDKKALLVSLLAAAIFAGPFIIPDKVINRVMHTFSQRTQSGQEQIGSVKVDTSTSIRLRSWSRGFDAVMERPLFGYGVTGWYFIDNQFTKVLVETGFIGLSAFLFLLFSIFKESFKVLRSTDDRFFKGLTIGFIAGLVGIIFHSIGANTFIIVRIMEPFWLLAGLIMVIPEIQAEESRKTLA